MAAAVAGQKCHLAPFQFAQDERIGGLAKGGFDAFFVDVGESWHGIEPAAPDNADFRFSQIVLPQCGAEVRPAQNACKHSSIKGRGLLACPGWMGSSSARVGFQLRPTRAGLLLMAEAWAKQRTRANAVMHSGWRHTQGHEVLFDRGGLVPSQVSEARPGAPLFVLRLESSGPVLCDGT